MRSVVGRFLEHPRVYYFENGGTPEVYLGSADMMQRNMFNRVEVCFPIENKKLRSRIVQDLEWYLRDNSQAWLLMPDGIYVRAESGGEEPFSAQQALLESLAETT